MRLLLLSMALLLAGSCATSQEKLAAGMLKTDHVVTPAEAAERLRVGNLRFAENRPINFSVTVEEFQRHAQGQHPIAIVLGCADSRVPLDRIFDTHMGEIFGLRVAGNVTTEQLMGSAQYAVSTMGTPLFVVLGHSSCGGVSGALHYSDYKGKVPQELDALLSNIHEGLEEKNAVHVPIDEAVRANVRHQMERVGEDPMMRQAVESGKLQIIGGVFEISTGRVDWL